jgi:hypothetical protein
VGHNRACNGVTLPFFFFFLVIPPAAVAFFHKETLPFTANSLQMLNTSFITPLLATGMALPPGNAMPVYVAVFRKAGHPLLIHISQILISYSLSSFREKPLLKYSMSPEMCAVRRKYLEVNTEHLVSKYFLYFL